MTVLTQLFEAPQIRYDYFDGRPEVGTEEFGQTTLRAGLQFLKDSYLHSLALAQEEAMKNDTDGLLITDAFKMLAEMALQNVAGDNPLAEHIADATISALDHLHQPVLDILTKEKWILWSQDDSQIVLNLEVVMNRLNGAD